MEGISIVVFMVRCTASLLFCDTIPTEHLRFAGIEHCRGEASRLIATRQEQDHSGVWMAKCRYQLATPDRRRARQADAAPAPFLTTSRRAPQ